LNSSGSCFAALNNVYLNLNQYFLLVPLGSFNNCVVRFCFCFLFFCFYYLYKMCTYLK
jgi:hypothetical protein